MLDTLVPVYYKDRVVFFFLILIEQQHKQNKKFFLKKNIKRFVTAVSSKFWHILISESSWQLYPAWSTSCNNENDERPIHILSPCIKSISKYMFFNKLGDNMFMSIHAFIYIKWPFQEVI